MSICKVNRKDGLMGIEYRRLLCFVASALLMTACGKYSPAGFWLDFNSHQPVKATNDQGPWGGHREILWKGHVGEFSKKDVIAFATKNGWIFTGSLHYSNGLIQPSSTFSENDYSFDILEAAVSGEIKLKDATILVFRTNWIAVEPGNERETEKKRLCSNS